MSAVRAYIGLGSNLDDPQRQLLQALDALKRLYHSRLIAHSRFYCNPPMGPQDQPPYVNAVAALDTELAPLQLLDALQAIELAQGRVREKRWGARTLDLDLLLYSSSVIAHPRLTVPHPGMMERNFVLYPLAELSPDLLFPDGRKLVEVLANVPRTGLEALD